MARGLGLELGGELIWSRRDCLSRDSSTVEGLRSRSRTRTNGLKTGRSYQTARRSKNDVERMAVSRTNGLIAVGVRTVRKIDSLVERLFGRSKKKNRCRDDANRRF